MNERRPNPEDLLALAKEEERKEIRGKLKIYFGSAPGVGKTHTMLAAALEKLLFEGIDVVVGVVETHGRKEVESMVAQFELIPRQKVNYHGRVLQEFDLDKALQRKPTLILIDELAHTNLPNSRHAKRWQDIEEVLDHGIDVYTTLNVQHLESLNDVIAQITGVVVRETVPDAILEGADAIELIDLPPDDLLKRLSEGRVYAPFQAELAQQNFFNKGNLIALRELALRITAERASAQALTYRKSEAIQKTWPTTERLLVCIGPDAQSAKLVRAARRMAARLQAEWLAVYVMPSKQKLSDIEKQHLDNNFRLAERLGGEIFTLSGRDVLEELISFARDHNVTKIVIGKEMQSRFKTFFFGSFVDELLRRSGDIDIYVIQGGYDKSHRFLPIINLQLKSTWQSYALSFAVLLLCTAIGFMFPKRFEAGNAGMVYLLGIVIVSMRGEIGPAILNLLLSAFAFAFFFVPPKYSYSLIIKDTQHFVTFVVMLIVSLLVCHLVIRNKKQLAVARLRERRTSAMYALSRKLANSRGLDKILRTATQHISEVFASEVAALLPDETGELIIKANSGALFTLDEKELSVARWVYNLGQLAGLGTKTLPFVPALYVPLLGKKEIVGVLRILPADPNRLAIPEQLHLLETFANQTALVIETDMFSSGAG